MLGTCGACLGRFTVGPDGRVMRHGWREVGGVRRVGETENVWHFGTCFGVGREPYETSVDCTLAFLETVLRPTRLRLERAVANPTGDSSEALSRAQLASVLDATERCEEAAKAWASAALAPLPRRGPRVHLADDDPRFAACGKRLKAWANSRPLPTTTRPSEVTCPRAGCAAPEGMPPPTDIVAPEGADSTTGDKPDDHAEAE